MLVFEQQPRGIVGDNLKVGAAIRRARRIIPVEEGEVGGSRQQFFSALKVLVKLLQL